MPHYFFHLRNDLDTEDEEGVDLPDLTAVREYAMVNVRELVCASVQKGSVNLDHYILVTDEAGREVLKLTYREAFTIEGALQR